MYLRRENWQLFCRCLSISHLNNLFTMHSNECWNCRGAVPCIWYLSECAAYPSTTDSRATCNRARPRCSRCIKSNRQCQYGLRLSWPKPTNTKRSLTHSVRDGFGTAKRVSSSQASFVNATSWDIELHYYLRMNQGWPRPRSEFGYHPSWWFGNRTWQLWGICSSKTRFADGAIMASNRPSSWGKRTAWSL